MRHNLDTYLPAIWITAGIVWAAGWKAVKRTQRTQLPRARLLHVALISSALLFLFSKQIRVGVLAIQIVPDEDWVQFLGLALTVTGVGFAIWARVWLRGNWSSVVTIKEDHSLVRHGPYSIVRHPIYSGLLLAMVGTALVYGRVASLLALPIGFIAWWSKSRVEEKFLAVQFGDAYAEYQRQVRALIPFIL